VGSTALKLLRKCPCPVWVTPRRYIRGPKVVLSAAGFHGLTPQILELSRRTVEVAGGDWHVVHCMEYPEEAAMRLRKEPPEVLAAYHAEAQKVAWERLHALCDGYTDPKPRLWLAEGQPDEQVVKASQELGADVVVMGTVGRVGVPGFIIGNTAGKILQVVDCSVLAVKPEGFVSPVQPD
jgi:nucleotide-binding universal stress UspA family protein